MLLILVSMVVVMSLAGLVAAFVAYPDRGQPIPHAPRLTAAMTRLRRHIEP